MRQRRGERQRLTNIALLIGLLYPRQLVVEQCIGRLLTTGRRGVAVEICRLTQILRRGPVAAAALCGITHVHQHIDILQVGLQHLLRLLLRDGDTVAIQIGVTLVTRLAATSFARVVLNFAILWIPLRPGIIIPFIPDPRAQLGWCPTQAAVCLFIAVGHRLRQDDFFPVDLFPPG